MDFIAFYCVKLIFAINSNKFYSREKFLLKLRHVLKVRELRICDVISSYKMYVKIVSNVRRSEKICF